MTSILYCDQSHDLFFFSKNWYKAFVELILHEIQTVPLNTILYFVHFDNWIDVITSVCWIGICGFAVVSSAIGKDKHSHHLTNSIKSTLSKPKGRFFYQFDWFEVQTLNTQSYTSDFATHINLACSYLYDELERVIKPCHTNLRKSIFKYMFIVTLYFSSSEL